MRQVFLLLTLALLVSTCRKDLTEPTELEKGPKSTFDYEAYINSTPFLKKFFSNEFISSEHSNIKEVNDFEKLLSSRSQGMVEKFNQIKYVIAYQDSLEQFMGDLTRWYGFPAWSYSRVSFDEKVWMIPFFRTSSTFTEAILFVKTEGDYFDFHIVPRVFIDAQIISGVYERNFVFAFLAFSYYDGDLLNYAEEPWRDWWHNNSDSLDRIMPRNLCTQTYCVHTWPGQGTCCEGGGGGGLGDMWRAIAYVQPRSDCPPGMTEVTISYSCGNENNNGWGSTFFNGWSPPVAAGLSTWGGMFGAWRRPPLMTSGGNGAGSENGNANETENSMPDWHEQTSLCILYGPESVVGLGDEDFDPTGTEQNPLSAADRQIMNQLEAIDGLTGLTCSQEMALWDTRTTLLPAILNFLGQGPWSGTALAAIRAYMNQTPNPDLNSFEDFLDFYRMVTEELGPALELAEQEVAWLLGEKNLATEIHAFLQSKGESEANASRAIAKAYFLLVQEEGMISLDLNFIDGGPLWEIMKEALLEILKEVLIDFIPGAILATLGPELFDNLQDGNWMDAMYNALDIVLNEADAFFPAAKVASTGIGLFVKGRQLQRFHKAYKEANALGENFLKGLHNTLRERQGKSLSWIRENFEWLGKSPDGTTKIGAKLNNITANGFFEDLKKEFGAIYAGFPDFDLNPVFKLNINQNDLAIYMIQYPSSHSGYSWTISFILAPAGANDWGDIKNKKKFKIRFD